MKPTLRIAVIAAGLAVAAWPVLRAADESSQAAPPPPPPVAAGGEQGPEAHPHRWQRNPAERAQHLKQVLELTQEQFDQVLAMLKDAEAQRQAIMSEDRHAKMRELMNGTQAKIRALLTPEQQTKFDAMPRPGKGGRNDGPGHGNPPPPPPPPGGTPPPSAPPASGSNT